MRRTGRTFHAAFTVVELIVVITVIALILAIAIPGLNAMNLESRFNAATQTINGVLTRAYYTSLADVNMTAVRFVPGEWDYDESAESQRPTGRQHIVSYSYMGTNAADPDYPESVQFGEYFQRRDGVTSVQLPEDIWVAPVEALDMGGRSIPVSTSDGTYDTTFYGNVGRDFVLGGERGVFALDAANTSSNFRQADDFLLTFDPQSGLRSGLPMPSRLKAFYPNSNYANGGIETDRDPNDWDVSYQRYSFSGIVLYRRELLVALENESAEERQEWLRRAGRPYLVHRFSGGLVMGTQGSD